MPRRMRRRSGSVSHCAPWESKCGSTKPSCAVATRGMPRSGYALRHVRSSYLSSHSIPKRARRATSAPSRSLPTTRTPNDMQGIDSEVFLVGDLHVEVGQQRITRAGTDITLPNLSFELLLALIRVAPNFLSNDLLMARVWPGQIVSPETVAKRVNLLRAALGDNANEPRYIAGVRGRGYRLVAAVSPAVRPAPPVADPLPAAAIVKQPNKLSTGDSVATERRTVTAKPRPSWWLVLSVLVAVIVAVALTVRTTDRSRSVGAQPQRESPLRETGAISARART